MCNTASITFAVQGSIINIITWFAYDRVLEEADRRAGDRPGRAKCWIGGREDIVVLIDAKTDSNGDNFKWTHLASGLKQVNNTVTCEVLAESSSAGHNFRIMGFASAKF